MASVAYSFVLVGIAQVNTLTPTPTKIFTKRQAKRKIRTSSPDHRPPTASPSPDNVTHRITHRTIGEFGMLRTRTLPRAGLAVVVISLALWLVCNHLVPLTTTLFACTFTLAVYRLILHPLASVPGPRIAALSNVWYAYHARNGLVAQLAKTLHEKYGPVVRVGPNEVWFNSKAAFKAIYSDAPHLTHVPVIHMANSFLSRQWQRL